MASGMTTQRVQTGSDPGGHGPVRTTCPLKQNRKRPSLPLAKFRFPPKVPSPARNIVSRPFLIFVSLPFCIFCFVMPGRRGGNGEQQYTLFCHDVEIFPPKMTKKRTTTASV